MEQKTIVGVLSAAVLATLLLGVSLVNAASLDIRISETYGDVEERVSDGDIYATSSDLELTHDGTTLQLIGLRFSGVGIPAGAIITSAYLEFSVDETNDDNPCDLLIVGEASANAAVITDVNYNVSSRTTTTASVAWSPTEWDTKQVAHQTPDVSSIVSEVIGLNDWASGNAMVFMISGSGRRTAESYNGTSAEAPLLHIEYDVPPLLSVDPENLTAVVLEGANAVTQTFTVSNAGDASLDYVVDEDADWFSCSPVSGTLTGGATQTITITYVTDTLVPATYSEVITISATDTDSGNVSANSPLTVKVDLTVNDAVPVISVSPESLVAVGVVGDDAPDDSFTITNDGTDVLFYSITDDSADHDGTPWLYCTPATGTLDPGDSVVITVTYDNDRISQGKYKAIITIVDTDDDGDGAAPNSPLTMDVDLVYDGDPEIAVYPSSLNTYAPEGSDAGQRIFTLTNDGGVGDTLNYSIDCSAASWILSCSPSTGDLAYGASADITVTFDTDTLATGSYLATIVITDRDTDGDNGANNSPFEYDAGLIVYPEASGSSCGDVPVYTENLVSPAMLILLDVSSSMTSSVAGGDQPETPDLTSVVQEIVSQSGWSSGNAMTFFIEGSGHRTADSYDGDSETAPLLHVEYDSGMIEEVRVSQGSDDAEEKVSSGSVYLTSSDLELVDDSGDQIIGIRFASVAIPNNAAITNAYIVFAIDEENSETTNLIISGELDTDSSSFTNNSYDVSGRTKTGASVAWNDVEEWGGNRRVDVGKSVISELVTDESISWGYGTWCFDHYDAGHGYDGDDTTGTTTLVTDGGSYTVPTYPADTEYYTRIHVGTEFHDTAHQDALQDAIAATDAISGTPLGPSMLAAEKYFSGNTSDEVCSEVWSASCASGSSYDTSLECQPKILINITDGLGYSPHTTVDYMKAYAHYLADNEITAVGVGFGLDNASQLNELAMVSNARGNADENDDLYALHEEVGGVGVPFLANSRQELIDALRAISSSLKSQVFHGSAPAPTTSIDYGNIVITAKFDATDWSGELVANEYNAMTGALDTDDKWSATEAMPDAFSINAFTIDISGSVIAYPGVTPTDPNELNPFYQCKPLGDIINSTPVIVERPAFYYYFDDYSVFRDQQRERQKMVYIGANDGALHAFALDDGEEKWRFYPESVHDGLIAANIGTSKDMCNPLREPAGEYCHQYFVDGSPIAADVYDGFTSTWNTVLVTGLAEGGPYYFALDVTGGESFDAPSGASSYLWEFTDVDLGYAESEPAIARVAGVSYAKWGVFFGSGYSTTSSQSTKEAYLYGIDVYDKSDLWGTAGSTVNKVKISSVPLLDDALSSPIVVDINYDSLSDVLYIGNLYGSFYRVTHIGERETPVVSEFMTFNRTDHSNPIRAKADFAYAEDDDEIWVYFGTGKYEDVGDKTTMSQQYFVGLQDDLDGNYSYIWDAATNTIGSPSDSIKELTTTRVEIASGDQEGVYRIMSTCASDDVGSWLLELDNSSVGMKGSERVISQPLIVGEVAFFTTFIPDENVCAGNGEAWLYALDYKTGCSVADSVFDVNGDGEFDSDDDVTYDGNTYKVVAVRVGSGQPSRPVLEDDIMFITTTGDGLNPRKVNLPNKKAKLRSWTDRVQ